MMANLVPREGMGKYYKTTIILEENGKDIGFIHIKIEPEDYSFDEISPRETIPYGGYDIEWNHIETKRTFELATKIVEMINMNPKCFDCKYRNTVKYSSTHKGKYCYLYDNIDACIDIVKEENK